MEQLFFNQLEVSKACNVAPSTLSHHIGVGAIPEPTMRVGRRSFFTAEERSLIVAYFERRKQNQ
jgi:hypothetical protein